MGVLADSSHQLAAGVNPSPSGEKPAFHREGGMTEPCARPGLSRLKTQRRPSRRGAVDETRTRDLNLGKVALYQLSYYRKCALARLVRTKRLELPRRKALDPKSSASAIPPRPRVPIDPENGDPSATRTRDTLIKSQVLCQLS